MKELPIKKLAILFTLAVLIFMVENACAQKVYKCTSATGVVTFTHDPCGADAKEIDTSKANKHSAPHDRTDITNAIALDDLDRDCQSRIDTMIHNANIDINRISAQVNTLRNSMEYSRNNLAGAQRDTGIQTEISGLENRIATMESTRDNAVLATQDSCRKRRDTEVERQEKEKQRKLETQVKREDQ